MTGWRMDAVIHRLLDPDEIAAVIEVADTLPDGLIKDRAEVPCLSGRRIGISVGDCSRP